MFFDKRFKSTLLTSVSMGAVLIGTNALANPEGANVVTGDVAINGLGTDHVIIQNDSNRAVVNWDKFSIGAGETTTINQITNDSAILNRVVTNNVSEIYGTLESNGQVFLVNQSGIVIGASGIVDTNGLVASTLDVSNTDFLGAGEMIFSQGIQSGGGIEVHGKIRSVSGGDIFLLSREITIGSTAEISSDGGYVGLGAGEEILLRPTDTGDGRISIRAGKGKIVNQGTIEGIAAELKAAGGNEYALAINNTGVVRATGYSKKGGKIRLGGGGKVRNTGKLVARKKVIVRSKKKIENSGQIKAGDGNNGGEIIFEAPEIEVKTDSILDVAGALGGGRIFVGGGYQGTQADSQGNAVDITDNAINVTVDDGAVLTASATQSGDAGEIVVWADGETVFAGDIVATAAQGRGGDVEVSGKDTLNIAGIAVDLKGSEGNGTLLLDPDDITVNAGGATGANTIADTDIVSILASADVNILTGGAAGSANVGGFTSGGGGAGDVTFETGVRILWAGDGKLTVTAENDIKAEDDVIIQHRDSATAGAGGVVFTAGNDIIIGGTTGRTGGVAIGSEHGENSFTAGNDVFVVGGNAQNAFAHLGFVQNASDSSGFSNGKITVHAGNDVTLQGGDELGAFAQIGHGGAATVKGIADISGDIEVKSDTDGSDGGDVILTHAVKDSAQSGAGFGTHAQIGHGSFISTVLLGSDEALTQGDISGNISITTGATGNTDANLKINTEFADSDDGNQDAYLSQIGHGGNIYYFGTTVAGNEITYGDISGDITLDINGKVEVGVEAAPGDGKDEFVIQGQIGHGGLASLNYNGDPSRATDDNSYDAVHGNISGDINVTAAQVDLIAKDAAQNSALGDGTVVDNSQQSQIGHGTTSAFNRDAKAFGTSSVLNGAYVVSGIGTGVNGLTLSQVQAQFDAGTLDTSGLTDAQKENFAANLQTNIDNATTPTTVAADPTFGLSKDVARNVTITDNRISGNITVTDDTSDDAGITLDSGITVGLNAITKDVMVTRIGHASVVGVDSLHGSEFTLLTGRTDAFNGGNVTIRQAHILGADILVDTSSNVGKTDDITLKTSIAAGLSSAEDNTAVAQIGHGGDVFVGTGNGGNSSVGDVNSGDGGDVTLIRGTVWDGGLVRDNDDGPEDNLTIINTTDITIRSANEIIIDSDTAAALSAAERNNSESSIGHGFKTRIVTGDGGTSTDNLGGGGAAGGAGGDILVYQGLDVREYGIDQGTGNNNGDGLGQYDDYAYGLRGDIYISATNKDGNAINITSDDTSALSKTDWNTDLSTIGHGDVMELVSGKGGDGSRGVDDEGDDTAIDTNGQVAVYGGRGGHIDVQLGRHTGVDQYSSMGGNNGSADGANMFSDTRIAGGNQADIGDTRALTLGAVAAPKRQGLSLIEGDIFVNVLGGTVNVAGSITNALSPSQHAISESIIGHAQRFTADAGDGGKAGKGNFHAQPETVFQSEKTGEEFLNYASGTGSNRGGNGGDVRLTHGDITDRIIANRIGDDDHAEITHDTDADHSGTANVTLTMDVGNTQNAGYAQVKTELVDGSSDIYMFLFDAENFEGDASKQKNPDSLIVKSTINSGLSEKNGSIYSTVGHHVRLIGEGGVGGDGNSTNTEFDQDGNSIYANTTPTDVDNSSPDAIDETAVQIGAVFIQPNSSGGRGGDALVVNNNISGDIVINAARRVTVQSGDGHGSNTLINATLGHTTDLFSTTQAGGAGADLLETGTNVKFDGGIINVGGGQNTDNTANVAGSGAFDHVLVDGNRDDQFNLENNDGNASQSTTGEDGIAVTPNDRNNRVGSTFASINTELGTLVKDTSGSPLNSDNVQKYLAADMNDVIFHDEEADPNFILDGMGNYVLNDETNNTNYAQHADNLARFGRVVATYDGAQIQPASENFFSVSNTVNINPGTDNRFVSLEVFVDMDLDGDVDLVDFDRDGRLDIVDVDRDGRMDVIDGRANYVDVLNRNSVNAVPENSGATNDISGLGVLDYVAVTGKGYNQATANTSGENWTNHNELRSDDLLSVYNNNKTLTIDGNAGVESDFVAYVSDFSTANGGRGGDAYSQVGYSSGDISVSTGANASDDSLIVKTTAPDAVAGNGAEDFLRAIIGHNAVQISDASGEYAAYRVGREGLNMESSEHSAATGGKAGQYAINGNGGRGGNAATIQGQKRDYTGIVGRVNVVNTELDHLVGDIFINTPTNGVDPDTSASSDAGRISITGDIGALTPKDHNLVSQIGHSALAAAAAGDGGIGASKGSTTGPNGGSQTELADGGDGGQAYVTEHHIKGDITVMAAADKGNEFSILMSATDADPLAGENLIIAQIGHGRQAKVNGGNGGDGNDAQFRGNGGAGGNATLNQNAILDARITIDLVDVARGYDGNGMKLLAETKTGSDDIFRVQVGHGDLGEAEAGNGGNGTPEFEVLEQRNQTANGGTGGDAVVNQAGYNYNITLDIGSNETGDEALQVLSSAAADTNGANDHILAAIGHGGLASSTGGNGGNGGLNGAITGIPTEVDPNLRDGDYFDRSSTSDLATDGDSAGVIDQGNFIALGTTRRGGDAGDGVVNQNIGGTGRTISGRTINNDYGRDDGDGADIIITVNDQFDDTADFAAGDDGVLIQTKLGKGSNQDSSLYVNSAIVGHHNFAEGTGGTGGNGIAGNLGSTISDGDGGDGGTGVANIYDVRGNISIDNNVGIVGDTTSTSDLDDASATKNTNITIETINGSIADPNTHRGDARVGHMSQAEANGGTGGESAREAGSPPSFPATISTQGGDGGDALTFQGQQEGDITLTAENSVIVTARDTSIGNGTLVAGIGHRVFAEATAGDGNFGGTYIADPVGSPADVAVTVTVSTTTYTLKTNGAGDEFLCDGNTCYPSTTTFDQTTGAPPPGTSVDGSTFTTVTRKSSVTNPYFTYEALREFHHRRTSGATDEAAFAALSEFEQQLVAPITDYFENKEGELEVFLDRLIGDNLELIQHNERDDDAIGGGDVTIPTLVEGSGHITGAGDGELETLVAILAASGHGGNASVTQGSAGLSGFTDELAASGNILLTAKAFDTGDAARGIIIEGVGGSIGTSFQMAHVGHQSEAHQLKAGNGKDVNGRNANANGIAGDGGDAVVDQYALNGSVDLVSDHKILVSARDTAAVAHETRAWVGHRLTIGSDHTVLREGNSVTAGNGGDEASVPFADGHNGNGGDVFIYQRGVISGTARTGTTASTYDTEIALAALKDSDDNNSITVEAQAVAASAPDVETHIGHDFLIHAVKAGDGGRQAVLSGPEGASEGLLEGNGGDIFIAQTDLGADIDIVGRDQVLITAITSAAAGNHSHLMIGHERTIGNSAELKDDVDGGIADNPRTGTIVAGFGGDAHIEDVNGTAMASRVAAAQGIIEDGDSGRIEIALGKLTDSLETTDDTRLVTITSITEDVDVLSNATLGKAILEIGNQQQVIAKTQSAGELQSVPFVQTAGDAGGIFINRDTINGDILIQAIDADTTADRAGSSGDVGRQVVIDSTSGGGSGKAITQIGHETQFTADTSVPVTARAAFGEDREFLFKTNLTAYIALDPAGGTANPGEATLRDAQNAVEDMRDVVRALELASENADRFPADDGVAEAAGATADRGEIFTLLGQARTALSNAESDLDSIGHNTGDPSEADAINAVMGHAQELVTAATAYEAILDAGVVPNSADQIADFAEGGDIVYGSPGTLALDGNNGLNGHTDSITGVAALAHTSVLSIQHAPALTAEGFTVADTGIVEGNIDILSGRDSDLTGINLESVSNVIGNDTILANNFGGTGFSADDDDDDSVVQITATANNKSLTEIGHRRIMVNTTEFGGGDTNAAPEEGGVAGDAGSIVASNTTRGDISVQAEEVVIQTKGALGDAELHLLHSSHTTNTTGWSDIQTKLGNGGDIYNTTAVSGGVAINAEQIASAVDAKDRKILATGVAETFIHMGHQAEDKNESKSDPNEAGSLGDAQTNLGSNRGGKVVSSQSVTGNSNGDLVIITLDAAGDGNASDLILETGSTGGSDIRLGNGEDGGMMGIYQDGTSGMNQSDDGGEITLTQIVGGDIEINTIEDLHINNAGAGGDENIYIGHDAEQFGQSGQVNNAPKTLQYGERVTVTQTITGNVNVETTSSYTASLAAAAGEIHVGHEGTQSAFSADDSANPSDLEDVNNDGIADNGTNSGEGPSATGVNDNFNQPDVLATQTIEAGISIVTGEITLENKGDAKAKLIHYGHEATHKAAVDGDLTDNFDGTNPSVTGTSVKEGSTGHVVASSKINAGGSDIYFEAKGSTVQNDTVLAPIHGTQGDIQLNSTDKGTIHVGHSSTSTMGDVTASKAPEGQFNAEQIIGTSTLDANGNEVADTSQSVIEFRAVQDIIVASVDGETQVGHFIVETGNAASTADPLNVDKDAATGLAEGDSELRQIVGSDILFGDKTNQGSGGVGENGAGNNVVIETGAAGRTIIGHQSSEDNEWQVTDDKRSVTVQLLDGDITIEAGTDEGLDAPDGTVIASATAAIADESGAGDDLLLLSGGGKLRIGHNMAGVDEGVFNETQRSAGDIWVRAGGDLHIVGGAIGHEHYDFAAITPTSKNATPESLASGTPIRDRIRGNTTIAAGQNSSTEDSTLIADILKIDGSKNAVEINSGYGGQGGKDVAGQLRFFLPAQEGLTILTAAKFNDSASNSDAVPTRSSNPENIFENEGGNDHEHFFELASESQPYTDEFIGAGNFTFYFEPKPQTGGVIPFEFSPFLYRGSNESGFDVIYLDDDGTSAGGAMNTDGLSEDYIGTSSYEVACDEQSQSSSISQEGSTSSGECSEVSDQYEGIQPGYGANTEWSGQAGGNASSVIPYLDEDDELGENKQVVGFTVYDEPVITTQTIAVERTSNSYFNVKTVTRKLPNYDGRVITRNSPSGVNPFEGFNRTVTNPSPLKHLKSPITTTTQGSGVNSFDVSNNAVFSTTTHQYFTGFDAGNDYQVTAVDNRIGTYVDDTGIDAYIAQHAGAMSFASSYQVFEQKAVE